MARYGKKASEKVEKVMHERKEGKLRSGGSHKKVTSRKQAIAIGLSKARREGAKVPPPKKKKKKAASKKKAGTKKKSPARKKPASKKKSSKKKKPSSRKKSTARRKRRSQ